MTQGLAILQNDQESRHPQDDSVDQVEDRSQFTIYKIGCEETIEPSGAPMHHDGEQ